MKTFFALFRLPVDAYNDGEVSFSLVKSVKRQLLFSRIAEEFSDGEDDVVTDSNFVKKSRVARFFASLLSLVLLPLLFIFRVCAGSFQAVARFVTTATRGWRAAKTDYNAFMSTSNVESTEAFTDDDDNDNEDVHFRRDRLIPAVPSNVVVSTNLSRRFLSFVTSFVPNASQPADSGTEETWLEVVIIRRFVRIFR